MMHERWRAVGQGVVVGTLLSMALLTVERALRPDVETWRPSAGAPVAVTVEPLAMLDAIAPVTQQLQPLPDHADGWARQGVLDHLARSGLADTLERLIGARPALALMPEERRGENGGLADLMADSIWIEPEGQTWLQIRRNLVHEHMHLLQGRVGVEWARADTVDVAQAGTYAARDRREQRAEALTLAYLWLDRAREAGAGHDADWLAVTLGLLDERVPGTRQGVQWLLAHPLVGAAGLDPAVATMAGVRAVEPPWGWAVVAERGALDTWTRSAHGSAVLIDARRPEERRALEAIERRMRER